MRLLAAANKARRFLKPTAIAFDARMLKPLSFETELLKQESQAIQHFLSSLKQSGAYDKCKQLSARLASADELKVALSHGSAVISDKRVHLAGA